MGYQINSAWTKLREKDILELNKIIDDEYCNEIEIGRKLNIMEAFEKKLDEAINDFDFDTVIKFMKSVNWEWAHYKNGKHYYAVPSRADIIDSIKSNFKHGLYNIIELNKKNYCVSGGGIVFDMGMKMDYPLSDTIWIDIYFDIAHFCK